MSNASSLPPDLLRDFADHGGGKVTLFIGAGCSLEAPTNLPLAADLSREVHRRLIQDGKLLTGCDDPKNLSQVADAVFDEHGSQKPFVDRMNIQKFKNVRPNDGHLIAAAFMRENIVSGVVTLNYDDAMSQAIGRVDGSGEIREIAGPEEHDQLGSVNLVYLHRKAGADSDELIMRSDALNKEWKDNWEEAIAHSQLVVPSSVFAGLGSPADVLTVSTKNIREAVEDQSSFYQVDPGEYEWEEDGETVKSAFTSALDIPKERYIQLGWCDFMKAVGDRVRREQIDALCQACVEEVRKYQDLIPSTDGDGIERLRQRIKEYFRTPPRSYSFLELGKLRARWFLDDSGEYFPQFRDDLSDQIAQLLVAVDYVARTYTFDQVIFSPGDGCATFKDSTTGRTVVAYLAHGRTRMAWRSLENKLPRDIDLQLARTTQPTCVLGSGFRGQPEDLSPPPDIAAPGPSDNDPNAPAEETSSPKITDADPPVTPVEAFEMHEKTETLDSIFGTNTES